MTDDVVARCEGVARTFGHGTRAVVAVHDATCRITAGERIALTGPSGSGKSTLLHLLAGLDEPTAGTVDWPALDGVENVALPLVLAGVDEARAQAAALAALERLGLEDLARKLPEELSGGQAQRVAVARALVGQPRLLLADEPTGQLDHGTGAEVVDALLDTAGHTGCALLVTTHDPAVAERLAERWHMVDGRLHTTDTTHTPGTTDTTEALSWSA